MLENVLFFLHYALLLVFGIWLSFAFCGVRCYKKTNICVMAGSFAVLGLLQVAILYYMGEDAVWKLYPVITHLPLLLVLCIFYRKRLITAIAAVASAYLCCQPAKWIGEFTLVFTKNAVIKELVQIMTIFVFGFFVLYYMSSCLAEIFCKDTKSICIFGSLPMIYYLFDYLTGIYTDIWKSNNSAVAEFLPFMLCIMFIIFCVAYNREYEQKTSAERNEQLIRIFTEEQTREMESYKRSEKEVRLLCHDMRHLLNAVAGCIENDEKEQAKELISSYVLNIERTKPKRFCENDMINYIISDFCTKCDIFAVDFEFTIEPEKLPEDEMVFASILSNALDNALNAQKKFLADQRQIKLMLKTVDEKLLLSVKNPVDKVPVFSDGLPVSEKKGHGYGTKSISYMAERLGGKCKFSVENGWFILRIII